MIQIFDTKWFLWSLFVLLLPIVVILDGVANQKELIQIMIRAGGTAVPAGLGFTLSWLFQKMENDGISILGGRLRND